MDKILQKILDDVDTDIKELMLADSETVTGLLFGEPVGFYKNWELLQQADITCLLWQMIRDNKNKNVNN